MVIKGIIFELVQDIDKNEMCKILVTSTDKLHCVYKEKYANFYFSSFISAYECRSCPSLITYFFLLLIILYYKNILFLE